MSKINYILGKDSLTVFLAGKPSYAINKQAANFKLVLNAIQADDVDALEKALNVRTAIASSLVAKGSGKVVIDGDSIKYDGQEVGGLIASRIFEVMRLGLDTGPMMKFIENLMENPSKRAVDELFGFLDACTLPITDDGHFLAYKRVRSDYKDWYSGTMDNSVGKKLSMPRNKVDEDKNRTCSAGLHFCSYGYLSSFGGDRIMVLKINPRDVVAIPADYNNSKGRTCAYEVVGELPLSEINKLPVKPIQDGFTTNYGSNGASGWDAPDDDNEWDESSEETTDIDAELDWLSRNDISDILAACKAGNDSLQDIADEWGISVDTVDYLMDTHDVEYGEDKPAKVASGGGVKLTAADVVAIRKLLDKNHTLASIAGKFGVHPRSIARIRDGEAWSDV